MRKTFSLPVAATAAGGGVTPPPADTVDNIEHSVRFDSAVITYFSRTPSSTGNVRKWTWSGWIKQSSLKTGYQTIFASGTSGAMEGLYILNNQLDVYLNGSWVLQSDPVLRDPAAWMHVVLAVDTDAATAPERVKLYINGVQTGNPSAAQNINTTINNSAYEHRIGAHITANLGFDGYLANVHFVDGYQKAASDFGFTDSNGIWQPKAYTGDYNGPDVNGATSPYVFPSSEPNSSYNSVSSVNSNSGNYAAPVTGGGSIKVKFASTQNNVTSISFRGGDWFASGLYDVYVNGTKVVNQASTAASWTEVTHNISSTNINEIEIRGAGGWSLAGLKFNGTLVSGTPSRGTSSYNGFYLDFADTSSATALGNDVSGNNNDFTASGLVAGPAYTANSWSTEFDGSGDYLTISNSADHSSL